jgi:hypothetical protein
MSAAEKIDYGVDKVSEERMAELIGVTKYTLEGKRKRGRIPEGVWNKIDGRITYSISRYEAWLESQWTGLPALNQSVKKSASGSRLTGSESAKRSSLPKRQKASNQPQVYVLK